MVLSKSQRRGGDCCGVGVNESMCCCAETKRQFMLEQICGADASDLGGRETTCLED